MRFRLSIPNSGTFKDEFGFIAILIKYLEYGVYGDLIIIYPKPYSTYMKGTIGLYKGPSFLESPISFLNCFRELYFVVPFSNERHNKLNPKP